MKTKLMERIFSAQKNRESKILNQFYTDLEIAKEDGELDTQEYSICFDEDGIHVLDNVNDEITHIKENEGEFKMEPGMKSYDKRISDEATTYSNVSFRKFERGQSSKDFPVYVLQDSKLKRLGKGASLIGLGAAVGAGGYHAYKKYKNRKAQKAKAKHFSDYEEYDQEFSRESRSQRLMKNILGNSGGVIGNLTGAKTATGTQFDAFAVPMANLQSTYLREKGSGLGEKFGKTKIGQALADGIIKTKAMRVGDSRIGHIIDKGVENVKDAPRNIKEGLKNLVANKNASEFIYAPAYFTDYKNKIKL
jgi:hypothetical protein